MKNEEKIRYISRADKLIENLLDTEERTIIDGSFIGTLTIFESLYGKNSQQAKALFETKKAFTKTQYNHTWELSSLRDSLIGTLQNVKDELQAGLVRNIATEATGIVIGDLIALAKEELKTGYTNVAAVLASAALEDALKRKAEELDINTNEKTLPEVINALKGKSFFKGAQVPIVSSYTKLRNAAMHADWDKINDSDVNSLLGFLEPFLLEHFTT